MAEVREWSDRRVRVELSDDLCECGCGQFTTRAPRSYPDRGVRKGEPRRFVFGHGPQSRPKPRPLCGCGCGERVAKPQHQWVDGHERLFLADYVVELETRCWLWVRGVNAYGYGLDRVDGRLVMAHRRYYERHVGPVPEGFHVHHDCGQRRCVNPEHLRPLTPSEHTSLHHRLGSYA